MALLANSTTRMIVQIVLGVVILILFYILYQSITGPIQTIEREQAITEISRERMDDLRKALIAYEREYEGYPATLDSLMHVIETDSFFVAARDSIFLLSEEGRTLNIDSLIYSSRGGTFDYRVGHDDSTNVWTYMIRDTATGDSIGTADPFRLSGMRNAASWE